MCFVHKISSWRRLHHHFAQNQRSCDFYAIFGPLEPIASHLAKASNMLKYNEPEMSKGHPARNGRATEKLNSL